MRHFHLTKNQYHCPIVNLDKLWSLVGNEVRGRGMRGGGGGRCDVVGSWGLCQGWGWWGSLSTCKPGYFLRPVFEPGCMHARCIPWCAQAREKYAKDKSVAPCIDVTKFGLSKVLGKGQLPKQPVVVKAKFFSKLAERKIKEVGGACILTA